MTAPGLILAAPASGQGKTVVTLAVIRALARGGIRVAAAKAGPDYIDPVFHTAAGGDPCFNLDPWGMRAQTLGALAAALGADSDLIVCEGVMGLFDGAADGTGSTADLAAATGWPVVLVVDARGQGASAAALVRGFAAHRDDVALAGVIFNRIGGRRHGEILTHALAAALPKIPVLGTLPRDESLVLPERHLGLVQAGEHPELDAFLDRAAALAGEHMDLAALRALARPARNAANAPSPLPPLGQRIAVARDDAFAFSYAAVLDGWRAAGAEIWPFSPLAGEAPGQDADAVYLPGGYPELHAGELAANGVFLDGLRAAAARGAAIFGECGGYMVLGQGLVDSAGARHAMAGLLALETSFAEPRLHLGYRRVGTLGQSPLGPAGGRFTGHEFHYAATLGEGPGEPLFAAADSSGAERGRTGLCDGNVAGSFIHLIDRAP